MSFKMLFVFSFRQGQIWCDRDRESESSVAPAAVEPSADLLQGAASPGRGASQQPQGVSHSVLKTEEIGQRHEPGMARGVSLGV